MTEDRRLPGPKRLAQLRRDRQLVWLLWCHVATLACDSALLSSQPLADRISDHGRERQAAIALIGAFHDGPRGVGETRLGDHLFSSVDEPTVHLPVLPLLLRDAPASQRIFLESFQPGLLRALVEMHPKLQDERAVVGEAALEVDDLVEPRTELGPVDPPANSVDQRTGVPRAQEEPDAALRRQVAPEAPVLRTLAALLPMVSRTHGSAASADPSIR